MTLQEKIMTQKLTGPDRPRHLNAGIASEFPVPAYGENDLEPSKNSELWHPPTIKC